MFFRTPIATVQKFHKPSFARKRFAAQPRTVTETTRQRFVCLSHEFIAAFVARVVHFPGAPTQGVPVCFALADPLVSSYECGKPWRVNRFSWLACGDGDWSPSTPPTVGRLSRNYLFIQLLAEQVNNALNLGKTSKSYNSDNHNFWTEPAIIGLSWQEWYWRSDIFHSCGNDLSVTGKYDIPDIFHFRENVYLARC